MKHVQFFVTLTVLMVLLFALTGCGRASVRSTPAPPIETIVSTGDTQLQEGEVQSSDTPDQSGVSSGSCVEMYSAATLKGRSIAFDGTIAAVEQRNDPALDDGQGGDVPQMSWVTFSVNHWYKGGDAKEVGVWMPMLQAPGTVSSDTSTPPISAHVGTRALVAGEALGVGTAPEQGIAWGCGFTQPYTADVAAQWKAALAK